MLEILSFNIFSENALINPIYVFPNVSLVVAASLVITISCTELMRYHISIVKRIDI